MPFDGRSGPLICTPHSVRMVQRDIKLVSRRICGRPKAMADICDACWFAATPHNAGDLCDSDGAPNLAGGVFGSVPYLKVPYCSHGDVAGGRLRSPYGKRGDRLWIRESCREREDGTYLYRADVPDEDARENGPWKNVRFVPKRAARTWLEVVDIRVEPVQEITPEDVIKEGVGADGQGMWPVSLFATLWDQINGKRPGGSWAANPWVWRLAFRRLPSAPSA